MQPTLVTGVGEESRPQFNTRLRPASVDRRVVRQSVTEEVHVVMHSPIVVKLRVGQRATCVGDYGVSRP